MAMAAKKKGTVETVTDAIQDAASAVAKVATENVVKPVGKALGLTGGKKGAAGKKSSAAKMMTKSVTGKKKTSAARTKSRKVGDAAKPSKGRGDTSAKGPRRGVSKGR